MTASGRVQGRLALVTGAGGGIGAACALALAREGAAVALADIDLAAAQREADAIVAEGGRAIAIAVDLGDEASVIAMVDAAVERLGGLDILHNNAADTRLERHAGHAGRARRHRRCGTRSCA